MLYYCALSLLLWSMNSACAVGHTETGFLLSSSFYCILGLFCNVFSMIESDTTSSRQSTGRNFVRNWFFFSFSFLLFGLLSSVRLDGMRKWRRRRRRSRAYKISTAAVCNCKWQCQGKKWILIRCGIFPLNLLLSFLWFFQWDQNTHTAQASTFLMLTLPGYTYVSVAFLNTRQLVSAGRKFWI